MKEEKIIKSLLSFNMDFLAEITTDPESARELNPSQIDEVKIIDEATEILFTNFIEGWFRIEKDILEYTLNWEHFPYLSPIVPKI